jgi:hypothetical protein
MREMRSAAPVPLPSPSRAAAHSPVGWGLKVCSPPGGQGGADVAAGRRGDRQDLEQMAEEHIEPTGQDDRRRQRQDPRQDDVAHGRPLQP